MESNNYFTLKNNQHSENYGNEFKDIFKNKINVDLKFICAENEIFYGHQIVMAMSSEFFRGVLQENNSCCCETTTIILPEIKQEIFDKILTFVYEGEVNVNEELMGEFFEVAKQLGIKGLVQQKQQEILKALNCEIDSEDENFYDDNNSPKSEENKPSTSLSLRIRATDPRPCPKCGKLYRSAHTLRTHLEDKHTSCPGYRCVLCGTVAKSRNSLHSHMSRQHRGISTKDLPVLPMPAPFDPQLAATLLGNYGNNNNNNRIIQDAEITGSAILDTYLAFIAENNWGGGSGRKE